MQFDDLNEVDLHAASPNEARYFTPSPSQNLDRFSSPNDNSTSINRTAPRKRPRFYRGTISSGFQPQADQEDLTTPKHSLLSPQ